MLPSYVSVSADGRVTTKERLVSQARRRGDSPDLAARVASWPATHAVYPKVEITGDTAVLTWQLGTVGDATVTSTDTFIYSDGRWRALVSQHTTASK